MIKEENLPEGWKIKHLSEICDVRDGTHDSPKYVNEGYPLITSKNLAKGYIDFEDAKLISKTDYEKVNKRSFVDNGDIIMPMIGTIGNPIIVEKEREFAIKNVALIKFNQTNVFNKYIKYLLDGPYFEYIIKRINRGGTQKFIALKDIRNFPILLPPLETQQKIVEILEKAEKLKEWRVEADVLTDEYLKSVFLEMFMNKNSNSKWETKPLSDVCDLNPRKSEVKDLPETEKVTFLPMESVGEDGEIYAQKTKSLGEVFKGYTYFKRNDVLFAKITPCMENGKGTIAKIDKNIGFGSTEFHVLRPKSEVTPEWIYHLLSLEHIRKFAEMNMTGSAGQKRVPKSFFEKLEGPIPPLELQNQFAEIVQKVEQIKKEQKQSKAQIDNLFNALMQKAFKGELTC